MKTKPFIVVLGLILVIVISLGLFLKNGTCVKKTSTNEDIEKNAVSQDVGSHGSGNELVIGNDDVSSGSGQKPMGPFIIGLKSWTFFSGDIVTVSAFMKQYQTVQPIGIPFFAVRQVFEEDGLCEDHTLIINGETEQYKKQFTIEDHDSLTEKAWNSDVYEGHREDVVLDFRNIKVGDIVSVSFAYGKYYDDPKDNPANGTHSAHHLRELYFYRGKEGIGVALDIEEAIKNYKEAVNEQFDSGPHYSDDICY